MYFTFDVATAVELRRLNKNREPSGFQLSKLAKGHIRLGPNKPKSEVYLMTYDPASPLRKLEVTGYSEEFSYKIVEMQRAPADCAYEAVFAEKGAALFENASLSDSFETVKVGLFNWLQAIDEKRVGRVSGPGTGQGQGGNGLGGVSFEDASVADDVMNRQKAVLESIQKQRDEFLMKQSGDFFSFV